MSNNVLKQMCIEIIDELNDCINILNEGDGSLNKDYQNRILDIYKIMCDE